MDKKTFDKILEDNGQFFSETTVHYFEQFSGKKLSAKFDTVQLKNVSEIKNDYIISISYLGMVFGEYIISLNKEAASKIFEEFGNDEETIQGCLKEVINMITGKSITKLGGAFDKLTMTTPKLVKGSLILADLTLAVSQIATEFGNIQCYIYIDRMKLDLASSYKDTIDILKSTNQQLNFANEKLKEQQTQLVHQEKMASLGMLAAGVAHEINNPLSFISGNIEVLTTYIDAMKTMISLYERVTTSVLETMNTQANQEIMKINNVGEKEKISFIIKDTEKLIAESKEGVERISKIVIALKKFSRVEDGQLKYVDINEELNNVLTILNSETSRKGCKVNINLNDLPKLRLESHGLSQVFSNLIINSLQAVKRNEGVIDIYGNVEDDNLILFFKDNGSGISEDNLKKVFNPFFTTKNIGEGAGLGLAISYGIIKKHNGNILVQSQVGKGTTFKLVIPIRERISYAS